MLPGRLHQSNVNMLRRPSFLILTGFILALMIAMAACQRAGSPTTPPATEIGLPTQRVDSQTPGMSSTEVAEQATQTAIAQITEQAYPQPVYPTPVPLTQAPYPEPSQRAVEPTIEISSATPSPALTPTSTQPPTIQPQATQTVSAQSSSPTPTVTSTQRLEPSSTATVYEEYPGPDYTPFIPPPLTAEYPGPELSPTNPPPAGAQATATIPGYPGSPTQTPAHTLTPRITITPGRTPLPSPTPFSREGTAGPTATEQPPPPPLSPPPAGSNVTIWHAWTPAETDMLREIIRAFQRSYPDVTFRLVFVPQDDLYGAFRAAAYYGQGPSLLLGPASWGAELFKEALIADLKPYIPLSYLSKLNPAALSSAIYQQAILNLPLSLRGTLMFRNQAIIDISPGSFEELIRLADHATHAGMVGSYLEQGAKFSAANIIGLGGQLLGGDSLPLFNDAYGIQWLDTLAAYDEAGAVTLNTNLDLQMFKRSRVGIIIDGSWNLQTLAQAIGDENLVIDPWPTYNGGQIAGWVEADSVYLNANIRGDDQFAALSFMGYLLDPNVQMRLAEGGHIPAVIDSQPRNEHIRQAMDAFLSGVPYPTTVGTDVLDIYWNELDQVIKDVFLNGVEPDTALSEARSRVIQAIKSLRATP